MDQDRAKKLSKHDQRQDPSSNYAHVASPTPGVASGTNKLALALDVRRGLIGVTTVAAIVAIAGVTYVFQRGFELRTVDGAGKTQEDRDDLLDKWNGYSGNFASAIGRPLETVIAMMTQLLVLRFLTNAMLQPEPKWHVAVVAVAVSAVLGFLLNNGLNALNVQLRDGDVEVVIQASDLRAATILDTANASVVTNISQTFAETQLNNPITNTVLRSVVMPRAVKEQAQCDPSPVYLTLQEDSISYGFQQQDWMKNVLPKALDAKKLRVLLNATDANANKAIKSADLPMNVSRAADLFVMASIVSRQYIPWGKVGEWNEYLKPEVFGNRKDGDSLPTAIAAGLLPPKASASELEQRDYFLSATQSFFNKRDMARTNMSKANIEMEFAHVDISSSITLDAMTLRVEVDPALMTNVRFANNNTRYGIATCGPWPGVCSIPKLERDPQEVVHAFSACANEDGSETLQSLPKSDGYMLAFNIHGRFVVQNPRKFYSFTVSRLGWVPQDLAAKYHGTCDSPGGCMGLDLETSNNQSLIAGLDSLPLGGLSSLRFDGGTNDVGLSPYRIVTLIEPPLKDESVITADYVLAHNVGSNNMNRTRQTGMRCLTHNEDRQQLVLNNHLYMESSFQTTYTAGVFFLFQNAALRAKVTLSEARQTLAFNGNIPKLSLWISIPTWNAVLTGAGCVLLVVGFLSAMIWSSRGRSDATDSMESITTAHVIARVMLDDASFPPSVVHRRVVHDSSGNVVPRDKTSASLVDNFYIESLTLKPRDETKDRAAGFV